MRLRSIWKRRAPFAISAVAACVIALWSIDAISLFPPGLKPRPLEMATASTHVIVDTPKSAAIDLRQDTYTFEGLKNRSVLLGTMMASQPVRKRIAATVGVPAEVVRISAPLTPEAPRPRAEPDQQKHTSDILKLNDQYRVSIAANPTVPILDIYTMAPTAKAAEQLANGTVDSLKAYLADLARVQGTPPASQLQLRQLGRAEGGVVNKGINLQLMLVAAFLGFFITFGTIGFFTRIVRGWRAAALAERTATTA